MQGVWSAGSSAQAYFEHHVRKLTPGYQATMNGLSYPLRVLEVVRQRPAAPDLPGLGTRIDKLA